MSEWIDVKDGMSDDQFLSLCAFVGALGDLMVEKGIFTEAEFNDKSSAVREKLDAAVAETKASPFRPTPTGVL